MLWTFDPESWRAEESWGWHRGPAYWSDAHLYSVDAKTGEPDSTFG